MGRQTYSYMVDGGSSMSLQEEYEQMKKDLKHMIMYVKMAPHVTIRGRRERAEYAARLERRYFE